MWAMTNWSRRAMSPVRAYSANVSRMESRSATGARRTVLVPFDQAKLRTQRAGPEMVLVDEGVQDHR